MTPEEQARFEALERRVAELERKVGQRDASSGGPVLQPAAPPVVPRTPPTAPRRPLETTVGVNWISRIAVVTVVLALAFFFEYAFENHWITERGRVLLGLALAAAALAFGERFWRTSQRAYGQSLAAAGIAFLYLSFWAAFAMYHLLPQGAAFGLMVLTTAAAGFLALRYASQAVVLLGLAGGFATPLLLQKAGDAWFILSYALLLDAGAIWVARMRQWRWTEPLAAAGTIVLYPNAGVPESFFAIFVAAYWALFAAAAQPLVFQAAELLAGTALVLIWTTGSGGLAGALLFAAAGLGVADRLRRPAAVAGSFAGFWLAYAVWRGNNDTVSLGPALVLLGLAFLLYPAWALWRTAVRRQALRLLDLLVLALNAAFFFGAAYALLRSGYAGFEGLLAVAVASVEAALARLLWQRDVRGSLLAAGAAWVFLVLAAPVQFAGYRITMAWSLEAAAVVWIGTRLGQRRAVAAALAVFVLAVGRLALLDSRMYTSPGQYAAIGNQRFVTFVVSAAALWAAAWWIRTGRTAQIVYTVGHAVMLWGLGLEAVGWAARSAAPENFRSVASTAVSVVAAAYAVLLVAGGAAWRHAGSRILGMGLIGFVVLKLYLYDVWLLGPFYRMAAFAILGVLLLVVSYVYSRRARA